MDKRTDYRYYRLRNGMIIDTEGESGYEVVEAENCVNPALILKHYSDNLGFLVRMGDEVGNLLEGLDLIRFKNCDVYEIRHPSPASYEYSQGPIYSFEIVAPLSGYHKPEDVCSIFAPSEDGYRLIAYKHHDNEWVFPVKKPWILQSDDEICGRK